MGRTTLSDEEFEKIHSEIPLHVQFKVKFSCGHTGYIPMAGNAEQRATQRKWLENSGLCLKCFIAVREGKLELATN